MLYQCTKDLLKVLKVNVEGKPDIYNPLFAWDAKLIKIGRRQMYYMMNEATRLSVILYGVTAKEFRKFPQIVNEAIRQVSLDCQIPDLVIESYLEDGDYLIFSKITSAKRRGILNRTGIEVESNLSQIEDNVLIQRQLSRRQNQVAYKNTKGDYVVASEAFHDQVMALYTLSQANTQSNI